MTACGNVAGSTLLAPETTTSLSTTKSRTVDTEVIDVVVTVQRGEHHAIIPCQCVSCVTRVPADRQLVLGRLTVDDEGSVLGPVPLPIYQRLHVKSHLVLTVLGQLM